MFKFVLGYCFLFSSALFASENWCTDSPDEMILPLTFSVVDFSPACQNHDVCYFSLGRSKYECDRAFLNDLRDICDNHFNSWAHALHRAQCRGAAEVYHEGLVSGLHDLDRKSYDEAQNDTRDVLEYLQRLGRVVNDKIISWIVNRLAVLEADGVSAGEAVAQVSNEAASI